MKQEGPRLVCPSVSVSTLIIPHALVTRAGEGVGEGRVKREETILVVYYSWMNRKAMAESCG